MIIDTHAHYDDSAYDDDRDEVLAGLKDAGIEMVVDIGADIESSRMAVELAGKYDFIYASVGVHPSNVRDMSEKDGEWMLDALRNEKVLAVGEIGFDYYWDDNRDEQRKWFEFQLDIAKQAGKPIVVHSRDAAADTLDVIKNFKTDAYGIIHCFSYGKEMAREYLNLGYYIGVGGVLTFKNAKKLKEVVEYAPLERIVLETDCPYLTPVPFRGKRNTSAYLKYVIEEMAAIKKVSEEEVIRVTRENALRAYKKGVTHGLSGKSNQDISSDKYI